MPSCRLQLALRASLPACAPGAAPVRGWAVDELMLILHTVMHDFFRDTHLVSKLPHILSQLGHLLTVLMQWHEGLGWMFQTQRIFLGPKVEH